MDIGQERVRVILNVDNHLEQDGSVEVELKQVERGSQKAPKKKRAEFTEIKLDDSLPPETKKEEQLEVAEYSKSLERSSLEKGERTSQENIQEVVQLENQATESGNTEPAPQGHVFEVVKALKRQRIIFHMELLFRLPWEVMPFVFGMFIMVEGLNSSGWVELFAKGLVLELLVFIIS